MYSVNYNFILIVLGVGLEPTQPRWPRDFLTTLCYHSQITTTSWREVQYLTNIFGTPLVYRPNSASWIICCGLDCLFTILKFSRVSISYPTLIDTLDSNQQSPNVTAVIPLCLIINQNVPTYTNFNLGICRSASTRLESLPQEFALQHSRVSLLGLSFRSVLSINIIV